MTQETELKPCPFCGKSNSYIERKDHPFSFWIELFVRCFECRAQGPSCDVRDFEKEADAIDEAKRLWQSRAEDPIKAELVEALSTVYKHCLEVNVYEIYDESADFNNGYTTALEDLMNSDWLKKALEKAKGDK